MAKKPRPPQADPDLTVLLNAFQEANKELDAKALSAFFISMARHLHSHLMALTSICNTLATALSRDQRTQVLTWIDREVARARRNHQKDKKAFELIEAYLTSFAHFVRTFDKAESSTRAASTPPSGMEH